MSEIFFLDSSVRMPLVQLPVKTPVIPLRNARVLLSPGSGLSAEDLRRAGPVTDIVAPSLYHTAGIPRAREVFPNAKLWGPAGAVQGKPGIRWDAELSEAAWPFGEELPLVALGGLPGLNEVLFVHRPSRTLFVTDLAFNIRNPKGIGSFLIFSLFGTYRKFAVSRFFLKNVKDRTAFERSLALVFAHDFRRVAVSHGEIEENGRELLLNSLRERGFNPRF